MSLALQDKWKRGLDKIPTDLAICLQTKFMWCFQVRCSSTEIHSKKFGYITLG